MDIKFYYVLYSNKIELAIWGKDSNGIAISLLANMECEEAKRLRSQLDQAIKMKVD